MKGKMCGGKVTKKAAGGEVKTMAKKAMGGEMKPVAKKAYGGAAKPMAPVKKK